MTLHLSRDLTLPVRSVTEKLGFIGTTGSGKTYAASKLAELFWAEGAQFIVLDPVGTWYGLRLQADGKHPSSITIPIFGGLHGDVPLEPTGGALVANLIVDRALSVIVDVSQFEHDTQKAQFAKAFADRLFFRKKAAPSAVHLFMEECQEFVPQNPQKGEEGMLHAFTRMQKLGRNFGIGSSYISQRPQEVNKKALNLAQTLFVFRTTGLHERKAIEAWIQDKGLDQDIVGDLPKLSTGTCHVWSPEFLKVSKVVTISKKETFNASATPEVGATAKARELAPIDLDKIRVEMASTIEKAKAEDPKQLRQEIAKLNYRMLEIQRDFKNRPVPEDKQKTIEVPVLKEGQLKRIESLNTKAHSHIDGLAQIINDLKSSLSTVVTQLHLVAVGSSAAPPRHDSPPFNPQYAGAVPRGHGTRVTNHSVGDPGSTAHIIVPQQRILDALAWLESVGVKHARRSQVAFLAGASPTSSAFVNNLGALRTRALIAYPSHGNVGLTDTGHMLAAPMDRPLSPTELHEMIFKKLSSPQSSILQVLIGIYPKDLPREEVAQRAGASPTSSAYVNNLGALRSLGFIDYPSRGNVVAQPVLFLE